MAKGSSFQFDLSGLAGEPDPTELVREDENYLGIHFDNLHDLGEDLSGERIDPATGLPYDNDGPTEEEEMELYGMHVEDPDVTDIQEAAVQARITRICEELGVTGMSGSNFGTDFDDGEEFLAG